MAPPSILILPWLIPYIGALLSLILKGKSKSYQAVLMLFLSAFSASYVLGLVKHYGPLSFSKPWVKSIGVNISLYADSLSVFMSLIVAWLSFLIGFYSLKYMENDPGLTRYWFFFDFFVGSMQLLVLSGNLILMFIGWEGTGLASYALIGHWYTDEKERWVGDIGRTALGKPMSFSPSHAGVRALIFTRIGDVGFLAGIGLLYGLTGTLNIPEIAERAPEWAGLIASAGVLLPFLISFTLGALAKSAQFPFHEWLVTAMTGPTPVSALIHAATMVKAGVYFMLRFSPIFHSIMVDMPSLAPQIQSYFSLIALIGGFTAFFMATQALVARELKLILAFSTASQLGYMFLAAGVSGLIGEFSAGFISCLTHLISHAIFKASLFLIAGALIHVAETKYIDEMGGLSRLFKLSYLSMVLAALSLSGVPPFMGFWSKDSILEAAENSGAMIPFIFGVVTAFLTAYYSFRMVTKIFIHPPSKHIEELKKEHGIHKVSLIMLAPYLLLALASLVIGLFWPIIGVKIMELMTSNVIGLGEKVAFELHIDPFLTSISVALVLAGITVSYSIFSKESVELKIEREIMSKDGFSFVRNLLYDRYYVNSIYYRVIVDGFSQASKYIYKWFDTYIIDGIYHRAIPKITEALSGVFYKSIESDIIDEGYNKVIPKLFLAAGGEIRKVQTGKINQYLALFFAGLAILILIITVMP